jgi:hypothetical protein
VKLTVLHQSLAICRLQSDSASPDWLPRDGFVSLTRTTDELCVVCAEAVVPEGIRCERGWRALQVQGPLDFSLTGVLASLAGTLAEAGVSLFAVSTYDTDYVLVREGQLDHAKLALTAAGHSVAVDGPT